MEKNSSATKVTNVLSVADTDTAFEVYGSQPAAGFPAPGDDFVEEPLNLHDLLVDNPTATFFVRVSGDSMEGAKIFDGDVLVVDRSVDPQPGRIVVAAVYGELVVKRLRKGQNGFLLMSEQEGYEPILVDAEEGCTIWGVVVGSARVLG
jgi:DNA polymerase V